MIHITSLRKESADGWTKLIADIAHDRNDHRLAEPQIWIAVKDEYAHMLSDDVYDAFMLVPLVWGMYHKEDVHIHGCVSKRLYKNVMNYVQRILCDYSPKLSRINVTVDGFKAADGDPYTIGTGLSCGVDSLSTVYDRYVNENDPEYRINGLFFFNTGWHGSFYSDNAKRLCTNRYIMNKSAADELGLPLYMVESDLHAFTRQIPLKDCGDYFANYSCVLGLQKAIRRYYVAASYSYNEMHMFDRRGKDMSAFAEAYLIPLLSTESLEMIPDGCQYERGRKIENIADWNIARKYLTPCHGNINSDDPRNCSKCHKCLRTIFVLEVIDRMKDFAGVFDLDTYRKHSFAYKCDIVLKHWNDAHRLDNFTLARKYSFKLPSYITAWLYLFPRRALGFVKDNLRKLTGRH